MEAAERFGCQPPDGDDAPADRESVGKLDARCDLGTRGSAVSQRVSGMRRDDVPEEHVMLQSELVEHAVHDRGGRLRRPTARELPFGRKGDSGHPSTSIARRFSDKKQASTDALFEVLGETLAQKGSARSFGVLVEGRPDPG